MIGAHARIAKYRPPVTDTAADATSHRPPDMTRSWPLMLRLWREFLHRRLGGVLLGLYFMTLYSLSEVFSLKLLEPVIDRVFVARDPALLWPIVALVLLVFAVKSLANYAQAGIMAQVGLSLVADLQRTLFDRLLVQDQAFFQRHATGALMARFSVDAVAVRGAVTNALTSAGKDALSVVFLIGLLFWQDWQLALGALIVLPLAGYPIVLIGRAMRRRTGATQAGLGDLSGHLSEILQGIRQIRADRREDAETRRAAKLIHTVFERADRAARTRALSRPLIEFLGGVAVAGVVIFGGHRVINGDTTPGTFFSFIAALLSLHRPLKALANFNVSLQEGLAGAERLFALIDADTAVAERPGATDLAPLTDRIGFENVSLRFAGEPGSRPSAALDGIDLEIPAGRTLAVVGPSGAGKSSLLRLIPRLIDPSDGRVTFDGTDIRSARLATLRRQIAYVGQDVLLFDDTIAANIRLGRPAAPMADIIRAAEAAALADMIAAAPEGYDTQIGERGQKLSGGQRQRLALARAILKDSPILLLDEITSAQDTATQEAIEAGLAAACAGRTVVMVAHRLATVVNADRIVVMDAGRIVEIGRHDGLIAAGGLYASLWTAQTGGAETVPAARPP